MILADKIIYLRKQAGMSQEDLASQINVSRQSVSKWEGAQSIPDMDKIILLGKVFGVSTDFLLKDEIEEIEGHSIKESYIDKRKISLEEALSYIKVTNEIAPQMAFGVFLCIVSPIALILLTAKDSSNNINSAIGLSVLLILISCAVALFVFISSKTKEFSFLDKEDFELHYGVESVVEERQKERYSRNLLHVVAGIILCITSIIPLLFASETSTENIGVSITIFIVACGVFNIVYGYSKNSIYNKILKKEGYTVQSKNKDKKAEKIAAVYWPLIVLIYLAYSFISEDWGRSWIVWPIAGLGFPVILGIANLFSSKD